MEVAETPTQQQQQPTFPNFDYYGSPPPPPPSQSVPAAAQQPQTPSNNQGGGGGGGGSGQSMMMSRLEHEMREQQQPFCSPHNSPHHHFPQSQSDADYHNYVQKTVGWRQAHHMQQGTSSSLPTRFNPLAAANRLANRSSPISSFQPQR